MTPERRGVRVIDVCIVIAALHFVIFAVVAIERLSYPFDVEWMEGGELLHAVRVTEGKSIYAPPSAEFTAFFYTPLYPTVVALLARAFGGVTYALGRGVSIASTLATMALLTAVVRRESDTRYALLALFTYAALDRFAGTFFDVARPDALALALAFSSVALARYGRGDGSAVAAAISAVLATFTKQTMVILALTTAAWLIARDRRRGIVFSTVAASLGAIAGAILQVATNGWFGVYVVSGHQHHAFYWDNLVFYFWRDVLFLAPLLLLLPLAWGRSFYPKSPLLLLSCALAAAAFIQRAATLDYPPHMYFRELAYETPRILLLVPPVLIGAAVLGRLTADAPGARPPAGDLFWLWMFVGSLAAGAVGHATQWAYKNAFLPASLFGALFLAVAARTLAQRSRHTEYAVAGAFAIQLLALADAPMSRMPSSADRARVVALRKRIARIEGPVLVLSHPFLGYEHDGRTTLHQMGLSDLASMGGIQDFDAKLARHAWSAIITDEGDGLDAPPEIQESYEPVETLDGPWMKTGVRVHPAKLWKPRESS